MSHLPPYECCPLEEGLALKLHSWEQPIEREEILLMVSKYNVTREPAEKIILQGLPEQEFLTMKRFDFEEWQRVQHVRGLGFCEGEGTGESESEDGDWRGSEASETPTLVGDGGRERQHSAGPRYMGGENSDASSSSQPHSHGHDCHHHHAPLEETLPLPHWLAEPSQSEPTLDWFSRHNLCTHPPLDKGKGKETSTPNLAPSTSHAATQPLLEQTLLAMRSIPSPLTQKELDILKMQMFIDWAGEKPGYERAMLRTSSLVDLLREMEKDRLLDGVLGCLEERCGCEGEIASEDTSMCRSGTMVEVDEDDVQPVSPGAEALV